jgi:hypothetical protein
MGIEQLLTRRLHWGQQQRHLFAPIVTMHPTAKVALRSSSGITDSRKKWQ